MIIAGQIINNFSVPIGSTSISASYYDRSGYLVGQASGITPEFILYLGEKSSFEIAIGGPAGGLIIPAPAVRYISLDWSQPSLYEWQDVCLNYKLPNYYCLIRTGMMVSPLNTQNQPQQVGQNITVSIVENAPVKGDQAYQPSPLVVNVGQQVTWTNNDTQIHTSTSGTCRRCRIRASFAIQGFSAPGASFSFKFVNAGIITYYCTLHPQMTGHITVLPEDQ